MRLFYKELGSNTRFMVRVTLITIFTLLGVAIYTYTATSHPLYYEFLSICDELLSTARSVAVVGFAGVLGVYALEKRIMNNE